jgi:Flp pilus assembly protein TadG
LVEFALILPLFMMLVLGLFSGGITYNRKISLTQSAREGARFGSTLPQGATWASTLKQIVIQRSEGELTSSDTICVALVDGTSTAGNPPGAVDANHTTVPVASGPAVGCFDDGTGSGATRVQPSGKRVQVSVKRQGKDFIEGLFFKSPITLTSRSVAKYEL